MRDRYDYEQIVEATRLFLDGVEDNITSISERTNICPGRIRTWKRRYNIIANRFPANINCLQYISNLTYGVSDDVWNRWLVGIDARLEDIRNCDGQSNDIRGILEDIANKIDEDVAPAKGTNHEMIDGALAHFVDETRHYNDNE